MQKEQYNLTIRASIEKRLVDDDRPVGAYFTATGERLEVNETLDLGSLDFLGVCKTLGRLHEVVQELRDAS